MGPDEQARPGLWSVRALRLMVLAACVLMAPGADAQTLVGVVVETDGERRPISPWIYGVNAYDDLKIEQPYPLVRWGGNHTTRYSWEDDVANRAADWFYMNIPYDHPDPALLPVGSIVDRLVEQAFCQDTEVLLTVPIIGWTPHDRERRWGFSVAKYGLQQQTAPGDPDAGNGVWLDGTWVTGNDPADTSRAIDSTFVTGWLAHLSGRFGAPGNDGVRLYALDNEPMSWHVTHRDVHPEPVTYDEIWARTVEYASAIKAFDPDALVLGPVVWGWCAFWGSAADQASPEGGCGYGPDRWAHGDVPFLLWYLQQICDYEAEHGVLLVDFLDVHYYPATPGVALSSDESGDVSDRRLRSVRSLHDPDYVDESWIAERINLIPMLRGIVSENCPGLGVAITEYNWGNDEGASSALAQAEVLAIFGREGVDVATRWVVPKANTAVEDAFLLYLDYDGLGSRVVGDTVAATSEDALNVPAYAVVGDDGRLYALLFNKTWDAVSAEVTASMLLEGEVLVFGFAPSTPLGPRTAVEAMDGTFTVELPPRSATLAVAHDGSYEAGDGGVPDSGSDVSCSFDDLDAGSDPGAFDVGDDLPAETDAGGDAPAEMDAGGDVPTDGDTGDGDATDIVAQDPAPSDQSLDPEVDLSGGEPDLASLPDGATDSADGSGANGSSHSSSSGGGCSTAGTPLRGPYVLLLAAGFFIGHRKGARWCPRRSAS